MSVASDGAQARRGRPLRFLALVVTSWVGVRIVLLWPPLETAVGKVRALAPVALPQPAAPGSARRPPADPPRQDGVVAEPRDRPRRVAAAFRDSPPVAVLGVVRYDEPVAQPAAPPLLPGLPHEASARAEGRASSPWSASAWLVARGGAGLAPGGLGGQLGGSQAGVRIAYALDRRHRVALAGRVTTPLGGGLREAALGVEWQPTRLPVRLIAEHRFALGDGHGGPALGVVGGFGPVAVPLGFRLEGYGQAGAIRRTRSELYADGALRAAHTVTMLGATRLDLGAGIWGGAQRGAARLDVGPSLGLSVPIAKQNVRLSLDWRERIAGGAHPGSGPALTLGADF